jgi:hypothetical protein
MAAKKASAPVEEKKSGPPMTLAEQLAANA